MSQLNLVPAALRYTDLLFSRRHYCYAPLFFLSFFSFPPLRSRASTSMSMDSGVGSGIFRRVVSRHIKVCTPNCKGQEAT